MFMKMDLEPESQAYCGKQGRTLPEERIKHIVRDKMVYSWCWTIQAPKIVWQVCFQITCLFFVRDIFE